MVRRLTTGCRCIVILGGRVFIALPFMGPGDERRPGRIGGWRSWGWPHLSGASSAALPQDRWRSMAAWARPGRHAAGLRERDSVGAYLVRAGEGMPATAGRRPR